MVNIVAKANFNNNSNLLKMIDAVKELYTKIDAEVKKNGERRVARKRQ